MMKLWAISKDKKYYKIGETSDTKDWYELGVEVEKFIDRVERGDEVEIKFKVVEDKKVLTFIAVTKKAESQTRTNKSPDTTTGGGKGRNVDDRTISIERQALLKASCEAVKTLQGDIRNKEELVENIIYVFDQIYAKFLSK